MCDTCGCSDDPSMQIADSAESPSEHGYSHEHSPGTDHPYAHTGISHDPRTFMNMIMHTSIIMNTHMILERMRATHALAAP